ncbi:hypothetical protein JNK13_06465 [bacterium]|nr:hypothetical protein [bacterium]
MEKLIHKNEIKYNSIYKILISIFILLVAYYLYFGYFAFLRQYPFKDMDWNSNGFISPNEYIAASEIGVRATSQNCKEYFSTKDGLPIKTVCD